MLSDEEQIYKRISVELSKKHGRLIKVDDVKEIVRNYYEYTKYCMENWLTILIPYIGKLTPRNGIQERELFKLYGKSQNWSDEYIDSQIKNNRLKFYKKQIEEYAQTLCNG